MHTAPAHGVDDFATGARYGLSQLCDVDDGGRLRNGLPEYDGLFVFKANAPIIELLGNGALMGRQDVYPLLPSLLALPPAGHLPGHGAVVYQHGNAYDACGWFGDDLPGTGA